MKTVAMAADIAVAMMRSQGCELDFSIESIDEIDAQIEEFRCDDETVDSMPGTMTTFGIYVGEVLRRKLGRGMWVEDTRLGPLLAVDNIMLDPIGKCAKRLANGPEDSVRTFADVAVAMAERGARVFGDRSDAEVSEEQ